MLMLRKYTGALSLNTLNNKRSQYPDFNNNKKY